MSGKEKEGDETLRDAVKRRVAKEERAFRMVEKMVLDDTVDKQFFLNAGQFITISQYKDVIEERGITKMCGYPLCNNKLTQILKQKYKISMKEHKVYDITERKNFCSNICYKASKYYESQLSAEPVWMRDDEKSSVELKLFVEGKDPKHRVSGSGEEIVIDTNFSQYSSCDKTRDGSELSLEDTAEGMASGHETRNLDEQEKDYNIDHDTGVCTGHNYSGDHDLDDNDTNDDDDNVKNRNLLSKRQSSSAQRAYPVENTSENPGNSSPCQGGTAEKMCRKPEVPNIGSKSEVNKNTSQHRSVPISSWRENEGLAPKGTEEDKEQKSDLKQTVNSRRNYGDEICQTLNETFDKEQKSDLKQTVNSRRNYGDEICQTLNETSLESNVVSEKDPDARLGVGNSCVRSEKISCVGSRSLEDSSRVGSRRSEESSRVDSDEVLKRKKSVEVVRQTLREWCRAETWAYFAKCTRSEAGTEERTNFAFSRARNTNVTERDSDDDDNDGNEATIKEEFMTSVNTRDELETAGEKTIKKEPIIPFIDSKSPMSIRGKIVSQKLAKALSPMLSRLGLAFADVSDDVTNILKTLRFSSTNIVLKPFQWTLVGLTLLLTLMRCNTTLRTLLCARQKNLHSLLNEIAISENDLDGLVSVLIPTEGPASLEPAIVFDFDQRGFNIEQLD